MSYGWNDEGWPGLLTLRVAGPETTGLRPRVRRQAAQQSRRGSRNLVSSGIPGYPPGYQIRALILSPFRARARLCAIQRATLWSCLTLRKKTRTPKHFRARERPRHPPSPAIFIVATPARIYVVSTNPTPPPNHRFDDDGDVFDADRRAHYDALACGAIQFSERV